ncbi:uncharacterized protein STEHIDRAFT_103548 [Stereum hirsutum FP-91666 SS1]|uniref:uncharacterized protein n=1 Tax=Stereum hirsutum (strain FP-91666) TaxID=721885 RepID=UPI000444A502|nr:uncharacterized protein STEHIDRAFT_103548 [Stereum hirsutum FP-91666 SS1]EIM82041.1 hypothetical protein STEHIDRAFT_103548 [Stereum hirsutum FP-91666 SS1]
MDTSDATYVDVLIVGAGPAGLMAATALAKGGVNVKIVDQKPTSVAAGQADGLMPRTIEVLQSYGLAESLLKQTAQLHMMSFYNHQPEGGVKRTGRAPLITSQLNARYPFCGTLNQGAIEKVFLESLLEAGIVVDRPCRPISLAMSTDTKKLDDPHAYPVKVVLEHLDQQNEESEKKVVFAKFVIGTDGAHSWVRKSLGIQMEGETTDHVWGAIDIKITPESNFPDWRNTCTVNAANTTILMIPREQDMVRLYVELGLEDGLLDTASGRIAVGKIGPERILEITKPAFEPFVLEPASIDWWTVYIIGRRVASRFSVNDRAFIAGDACHTHSPKAGQGMNASMNDSHNLAWKLIYVLRGWADMSLLKTYEFERLKFAQDLIRFDGLYEAGFSVKARSELLKDKTKPPPEQFEAFHEYGGLTSGVGVQYSPSVITASYPGQTACHATKLIVGQRLPPQIVLHAADNRPVEIQDLCPSDTRFKILVFTGDILAPAQSERVQRFATGITRSTSIVSKLGDKAFDIMCVVKGEKETSVYLDVPSVLRSHWTKVLLDARNATHTGGGMMYESYGVSSDGAIVVVRPDGYVALVTALEDIVAFEQYFSGFLKV